MAFRSEVDLDIGSAMGNRTAQSVTAWDSLLDLHIAQNAYVGQAVLYGAHAGRHKVVADGYFGTLQVWGNGVDVTTKAAGAGIILSGDNRDTVTAKAGFVELINTHGGNDKVTIGSGGATTLRTGDDADTVVTGKGHVDLIDAGKGGDTVTLGSGGVGLVKLKGGTDIVKIGELDQSDDREDGTTIRGGGGTDTLVFNDYSRGVTLDLDKTGWQNPGGKGWVQILGIENVTGTNRADRLIADDNDNVLKGRAGADAFVFDAGAANSDDTVADFQDGKDVIEIDGHAGGVGTIGQTDHGGDLILTYEAGTITLDGLAGTTLTGADFLFT